MPRKDVTVDPALPLDECEEKPAAVAWPLPVDRRLDELVSRARDYGERTTRKELAAAIVFGFDSTAEDISALLRRFRTATAGDAVLERPTDENVLRLPRHRPGPRVRER